ncbi:50S ribosome-binding GTPase [Candidatus Aerophobetes bacterium]|nr:50S ribosome-binding GTPase [Candidatus Aerophobetes bacterium]
MPANLPPQYYEAERRYREAGSLEEKISLLQEMLAIMPKHKGTDKLQADLRARISKLKKTAEKKKGPHRSSQPYQIPKEGAAQVILIGPPNTGKSSILSALTRASPEIAPYPFTTHQPLVGMMEYEDIKIQLVDTPPIAEEFVIPWLGEIIKKGNLLVAVLDLGRDDILEQMEAILEKLKELKVEPENEKKDDEKGILYKKIAIIANKQDLDAEQVRLSILKEFYAQRFPLISGSVKFSQDMEKLKEKIYKALDIIRVYTKVPGQPPDMRDPVVLKKGSLVIDAARSIHKDFAHNLRYTRIWGSDEFKGQKVEKGHPLEEGDILEFHI